MAIHRGPHRDGLTQHEAPAGFRPAEDSVKLGSGLITDAVDKIPSVRMGGGIA